METISSSTYPRDVLTSFMQRNNIPGVLLFAMVTGSQSYNLATSNSDLDYIGVYALPTRNILSLKEQVWNVSTLPHSEKPDCTLYEIQKYLELLYKGNPFMMESLFTKLTEDQFHYAHPLFQPLILSRKQMKFITMPAIDEFLSYIQKSIKRDEEKPMKGKRKYPNSSLLLLRLPLTISIYHILRLLFEIERMLDQQEMKVYLDGWQHDILSKIRSEGISKDEFTKLVQEHLKQVEDLKKNSQLPVDFQSALSIANALLLNIRKNNLLQ